MWSGQRLARGLLAKPTTRQVMVYIRFFVPGLRHPFLSWSPLYLHTSHEKFGREEKCVRICVSDVWSNKIRMDPKKNSEDTIWKKWCRRFFCVSAAFALGLTNSQPKAVIFLDRCRLQKTVSGFAPSFLALKWLFALFFRRKTRFCCADTQIHIQNDHVFICRPYLHMWNLQIRVCILFVEQIIICI